MIFNIGDLLKSNKPNLRIELLNCSFANSQKAGLKMKVNEVDKNFDTTFECPSDIKWHSVLNKPFLSMGSFILKKKAYSAVYQKNLLQQ